MIPCLLTSGALIFILTILKDFLSFTVVVPLVTLVGGYFTYKLRGIQFRKLGLAVRLISPKGSDAGISSFGAIAAVLGGNLGTGNIAGIAVALTTGGPGSLFWMWIMAFLGSILKYVGSYLGVSYREMNNKGQYVGGPMYYLSKGLKKPFMAYVYCILLILGAVTTGNIVQVNSLTLPLTEAGYSPLYVSLLMALLLAGTTLGGMQRFSHVVSAIVPFMALAYLVTCGYILAGHTAQILPALKTIVDSAFDLKPLAGGAAGYGVFVALQSGFDRGLFATDSGLGLAAILHAPVTTQSDKVPSNAIAQGIMSVLSPLIVMCVCMLTGLVLMVTKAWQIPGLESTNQCMEAFCVGLGHSSAGFIVLVTLFFFAFTTVLTWAFCAGRAVAYLMGEEANKWFQVFFVCVVPLGGVLSVSLAWQMADIFLNLMLLLNMVGLWGLRRPVIEHTRVFLEGRFLKSKHAKDD